MMTNKLITAAGVCSILLTGVHIFGGGADVHTPLLESEIPQILKGFVSVIWHAVTANLLICSALLLIAARRSDLRIWFAGIVITQYLAYIFLFLFYGLAYLGTIFLMPPWIGFVIIVILTLVGLILDRKK